MLFAASRMTIPEDSDAHYIYMTLSSKLSEMFWTSECARFVPWPA